jgi:hypothetical protein
MRLYGLAEINPKLELTYFLTGLSELKASSKHSLNPAVCHSGKSAFFTDE